MAERNGETAVIALALGIIGTMLISVSVYGLHKKRGAKPQAELRTLICEAPSPDNSIKCDLELGHWGWHQNVTETWFGDAWDIDHWANTQQQPHIDPEPTMSATQWKLLPQQDQYNQEQYNRAQAQPRTSGETSRKNKRLIKRGLTPPPPQTQPVTHEQVFAMRSRFEEKRRDRQEKIRANPAPWQIDTPLPKTRVVKNPANLVAYGNPNTKFQYTTSEM